MPVTLSGKYLSGKTGEISVTVGGQKADVTSASAESITFTVPLMPEAEGGYYFNPPREFPVQVKDGGINVVFKGPKASLYIGPQAW